MKLNPAHGSLGFYKKPTMCLSINKSSLQGNSKSCILISLGLRCGPYLVLNDSVFTASETLNFKPLKSFNFTLASFIRVTILFDTVSAKL